MPKITANSQASDPPSERDLALLVALAEHKILSTYQLHVLYFAKLRTTQTCIHHLRQNGLINTFAWQNATGRASERQYLSDDGARLVAAYLGRQRKDITGIPTNDEDAKKKRHRAGVNAFFCSLVNDTLSREGFGIESWNGEHKISTPNGGVQPDGFGRLLHPDGATEFCFEYDRLTENRGALLRKLDSYVRITSAWRAPDDRPFPNVCFVLPNDDRERKLISLLVEIIARVDLTRVRDLHLRFYSSTMTLLRTRGHLGAVWRPMLGHPGDERLRLDELASVDASVYDLAACLGRRWRRGREETA